MKIVHIILTGPFTLKMTYQENHLIEQMVKDGHEVTVIASCEAHDHQAIITLPEEDTVLKDGYRLIRKEYRSILGSSFLSRKVRAVRKLRPLIESLTPDVIFHHGLQSMALKDLVWYKKQHPSTKLIVDSHEDFHNSARTFFSKYFLHKAFYRSIIRHALPYIDKVLYVTYESVDFLSSLYGIQEKLMEFYPLGGKILDEEDRQARRALIRQELNAKPDDIVCLHTGKMTPEKRTIEVLSAFNQTSSKRLKLVILGVFDDNIKAKALDLISQDSRIFYVGWKDAEGLMDYLAAADLYVQPGSQSATMQNALCLGCAAAVYPYESHQFLLGETVFYVQSYGDLVNLFELISTDSKAINKKREKSFNLAKETLDYEVLARKIYDK